METSYMYKNYQIYYTSLNGTTIVFYGFREVTRFMRRGEMEGDRLAREWIDELES